MLGLAHLFPDVGYCQESVIDSLKDDDDGGNDYDDRKRSYRKKDMIGSKWI